MKLKILGWLTILVQLLLLVGVVSVNAADNLTRLTITNKSSQNLGMWLIAHEHHYYLSVKPNSEMSFTVEKGSYFHAAPYCG